MGGIPITRIETLSGGRFNRDRVGYADILSTDGIEDRILQDGDILMSHINSPQFLGRAVMYQAKPNDCFIHGMNLLCLRADRQKIDPAYAAAYFQTQTFKRQVNKIAKKSVNQASFSTTALKDLTIPICNLRNQGEIANRFASISALMDDCERQLSTLDDLVKSEFVEMFGGDRNPVIRASEVLTNFRNGVSPSKMGKVHSDVLTLSSITRGRFDAAARKDGTFVEMPQADKRVSSRDFYICRGNGNKKLVGVAAFAEEDHPDLVFPDTMIAVTVNDSMVCQSYLAYEWAQPNVRRQIESKARTTNGTFKINQKTIAGVQIPLPPLEEQIKFADFVARVDKLRFDVQQQIEKLEALKQSLMQDYFG